MKKSWELGVTQSWNKIDPAEEAKIDEAAMGGEQEEEKDVGDEKEGVTQDARRRSRARRAPMTLKIRTSREIGAIEKV